MRGEFQRDRDRIIHSKAFRRLMGKTQVFLAPEPDHYRTRLTHTMEVTQIARTITRALRLNEDLTEAIALGHDLGHTPFGHAGERVLQKCYDRSFRHYRQSLRVVDLLEPLNLTEEVRDGILCHTNGVAYTLEGRIVRLADRIAYINHDIDDALRAGVISVNDLPKKEISLLGKSPSARINKMITSIYNRSYGENFVKMEDEVTECTDSLRDFMFKKVYLTKRAEAEEERAMNMISALYDYYKKRPEKMPAFYVSLLENYPLDTVVCDYISSMTDRFAVSAFEDIFVPARFYPERDEKK